MSPDGARVYVGHNDPDIFAVSVIDTSDHTVAEVKVGQGPLGVALTPDDAWVYVTNARDGTMSVIDTSDHSVSTGRVGKYPRRVTSFGIFVGPPPPPTPGALRFAAARTTGRPGPH